MAESELAAPVVEASIIDLLMEALHVRCKGLVETNWFRKIMIIIILLNPVALAPQVITAFTAPNIQGLSAPMWFLFVVIQAAFTLHGIKTKDASIFCSMLLSCMESTSVLLAICIRR